jgi:hypothetical protein
MVARPHAVDRIVEDTRAGGNLESGSSMVVRAYGLVQQFVTMVKERSAQQLDTWLLNCQTCGISELDNFAQGLQMASFHLPPSAHSRDDRSQFLHVFF